MTEKTIFSMLFSRPSHPRETNSLFAMESRKRLLAIDHSLLAEHINKNRIAILILNYGLGAFCLIYGTIILIYHFLLEPHNGWYHIERTTLLYLLAFLGFFTAATLHLLQHKVRFRRRMTVFHYYFIAFTILLAILSVALAYAELASGVMPVSYFTFMTILAFFFVPDPFLIAGLEVVGTTVLLLLCHFTGLTMNEHDYANFILYAIVMVVAVGVRYTGIMYGHRSEKKMANLAYTDELTLIPNRKRLEIDVNAFLQKGEPFTILMADLDGLKEINDREGHSRGDDVIVGSANALAHHFEHCYRYGGDEFVVLTTAPESELKRGLKEIKKELENLGVTVSFGLYSAKPGDSRDYCFAEVDRRLYESKKAGKGLFNGRGFEEEATQA